MGGWGQLAKLSLGKPLGFAGQLPPVWQHSTRSGKAPWEATSVEPKVGENRRKKPDDTPWQGHTSRHPAKQDRKKR
jgi:hypothetical protein